MQQNPEPEDSIDLVELAIALWRRKWQIAGVAALFIVAGTAYALLATPVYRAEVVLAPREAEQLPALAGGLGGLANLAGISLGSSADETQAVATLRSRAFIEEFIRDNELMPILFADEWDAAENRWIEDDPDNWPDILDGVKLFVEDVRTISEDTANGLITLSIEWSDAQLSADWTEELVARINERIRSRDLTDSQRRVDFLNAELEKASLVELRQAISRLIENQIEAVMIAQAEDDYAFIVIDPPRVPIEPIAPKKTLIVIFSAIIGTMIGAIIALLRWRLNIVIRDRARDTHDA